MLTIVADIESNGLLPAVSVIHCLCVQIFETGEMFSFADHAGYLPLEMGWELLLTADYVVGHNFMHYDAAVIQWVADVAIEPARIIDTYDLCEILIDQFEMQRMDYELHVKGLMPYNLINKFKLEAWGYRLGRLKGTFGKTADWKIFSDEMVQYCADDVLLNADLYRFFLEMGDKL